MFFTQVFLFNPKSAKVRSAFLAFFAFSNMTSAMRKIAKIEYEMSKISSFITTQALLNVIYTLTTLTLQVV